MIISPLNKQNGFASISILLFIPVVCLIFFSFGFLSYVIQYKTKLRSTCINKTIEIQKNIQNSEENLFKLNPQAVSLRLQLQIAYIELAAAIASENAPLAARIQIKISQLKLEQKELDTLQKLIIQTAEVNLNSQIYLLKLKLNKMAEEMSSNWSFYLDSITFIELVKIGAVAVKADSPDIAPVYELKKNHDELQRVAYKWQHRFKTKAETQEMVANQNLFEMSCGSSGRKKGGLWEILIDVDKY